METIINESSSKTLRVVLFPYPGFGHMIPHHQLAMALARVGVHVSYVSTPRNIQRLPKPPPNLANFFQFVELRFPTGDSNPLPEGAESTLDLPLHNNGCFIPAYYLLKNQFREFIAQNPPDWIVIDCHSLWATEIAQEHGVPLLFFGCVSAAAQGVLYPPERLTGSISLETLTSPPQWLNFPSSVCYLEYEAVRLVTPFPVDGLQSGTCIVLADRFARAANRCQAVAIRSCRELEGDYLSSYEMAIGKPVIPLGLLPPPPPVEPQGAGTETMDESWVQIFEWLDGRKKDSVVFVVFGSQTPIGKKELHEIAHGLEASELPFLWALGQMPSWAAADDDVDEVLPAGFRQRASDVGRVCTGWAPQQAILGHPSVGGVLFHSGWGSVIETLQHGHGLVLLPFIVDQFLNARLLVEKGLAIEVLRTGVDLGSFSRDDIAESLRRVMADSEEGQQMRERLRKAAALVRDRKLHDHYIDQCVQFLKNGVAKQK